MAHVYFHSNMSKYVYFWVLYPFVSFVGGVSILHVPYAPCIEYLPTCYHEFKANVGKHSSPMEHMGVKILTTISTRPQVTQAKHAEFPPTSGCRRKCFVAWLRCDGHGSHGTWANGRPPGPVGPVGVKGSSRITSSPRKRALSLAVTFNIYFYIAI